MLDGIPPKDGKYASELTLNGFQQPPLKDWLHVCFGRADFLVRMLPQFAGIGAVPNAIRLVVNVDSLCLELLTPWRDLPKRTKSPSSPKP